MILGAKALAVLDGEPAASADHVRQVAPYVLRHRVLPNYAAAGKGIDALQLIKKLLETVREPMSEAV
jgi:MoxR-like ATPase